MIASQWLSIIAIQQPLAEPVEDEVDNDEIPVKKNS